MATVAACHGRFWQCSQDDSGIQSDWIYHSLSSSHFCWSPTSSPSLVLARLGPLGRLILALILQLVAFLLGLVHALRVVLGRRIDGKQPQLFLARVDKVVLGALRDDANVAGVDRALFARDNRLARAVRKDQVLVDMVHFLADVAADGDRHLDELARLAGPEDTTELVGLSGKIGGDLGEHGHLVVGFHLAGGEIACGVGKGAEERGLSMGGRSDGQAASQGGCEGRRSCEHCGREREQE